MSLTGVARVSRDSATTCCDADRCRRVSGAAPWRRVQGTHTEGQVLCGKDASQALVFIDNQDTVGALGGTQLAGVGNGDVLGHGQGWTRAQGGDGTRLGAGRGRFLGRRGGRGWAGAALAAQLGFDLFADSLDRGRHVSCVKDRRQHRASCNDASRTVVTGRRLVAGGGWQGVAGGAGGRLAEGKVVRGGPGGAAYLVPLGDAAARVAGGIHR